MKQVPKPAALAELQAPPRPPTFKEKMFMNAVNTLRWMQGIRPEDRVPRIPHREVCVRSVQAPFNSIEKYF